MSKVYDTLQKVDLKLKGATMSEQNEEKGLEAFVRHGTEEKRIEVAVAEILNAIAEGRDIDVQYAVIKGDLNIQEIRDRLVRDEDGKLVVQANISIVETTFSGKAYFLGAAFSQDTSFRGDTFSEETDFRETVFRREACFRATVFRRDADFRRATFGGAADFRWDIFSGNADFGEATFHGHADFGVAIFNWDTNFRGVILSENADFSGATFNGNISFREATFRAGVAFNRTTMKHPANFKDLHFVENTVGVGFKNHILCPLVRYLTKGKASLQEKPVTRFLDFNTATLMDGSSNPYLRRYIDDEQWLRSWRECGGKWKRFLFIAWEAMSHCGRSLSLWVGWSIFFALVFAWIYRGLGGDRLAFNVGGLSGVQPDFWGYLYYSVVTFTTLGFGDIVPLDNGARLAVGLEVVLGYIMLGGLISIFAGKLARRA